MARWILLGLAVLGFGLSFAAKSPGVLGLGLLLGLVGLCGFIVSMAAARVSAAARPETSMASIEEYSVLGRSKAQAREATQAGGAAADPGQASIGIASNGATTARRNSN